MGKSRKNKSTQRDPVPSSNIKAQVKSEEPTQNQTPTDSTPQPKVAHVQSADQDSAKRDLMSTSQLRAYRSDEPLRSLSVLRCVYLRSY